MTTIQIVTICTVAFIMGGMLVHALMKSETFKKCLDMGYKGVVLVFNERSGVFAINMDYENSLEVSIGIIDSKVKKDWDNVIEWYELTNGIYKNLMKVGRSHSEAVEILRESVKDLKDIRKKELDNDLKDNG